MMKDIEIQELKQRLKKVDDDLKCIIQFINESQKNYEMEEIKQIGQQSTDFFGYLESIFRPVRSIKQFKMRAEGMSDIFCFINEVGKHPNGILEYKIESQGGIPDAIIAFDSALSKDEIRLVLEKIRDGHVMYDTLEYAEEYTGERI